MYALTGDQMYKEKAQEVADILLPAFNTSTGVPNSLVDIQTGVSNKIIVKLRTFRKQI